MRITAETVLGFLAAGESAEDILWQYKMMEREYINACLDFASRLLGHRYEIRDASEWRAS